MTGDINYLRQQDIITPRQLVWPVTVIGMGGIGTGFLGPGRALGIESWTLYDRDRVEEHNLPNQVVFRPTDARNSRYKVSAAQRELRRYGVTDITIHRQHFDGTQPLSGIVIAAVDSMSARKLIWEAVVRDRRHIPLFLDGRLGGEAFELFAIRPIRREDRKLYEDPEYLFDDDDADEAPCTAQSICYPAVGLGAHIAATITRWVRCEPYYRHWMFDYRGWFTEQGYLMAEYPQEVQAP